ncbi:MAG: hypothetical protein P9M07_02820 [Candidatus Aceula meridiana]|nr:hypothetical protein [Candidatus Aceula meridiana]
MISKNIILEILLCISVVGFGFAPVERATDGMENVHFQPGVLNRVHWEKLGSGIQESNIRCVAVDRKNPLHVFAGTSRAIYRSEDGATSFVAFLNIGVNRKIVNDIFIEQDQSGCVFVATDAGLFQKCSEQRSWEKTFSTNDTRNRSCFAVLSSQESIYLGTSDGLFYKKRVDTSWKRMKEALGTQAVYHLAQDEKYFYAAQADEIFRLDKQFMQAQRIFSLSAKEINGFSEEEGEVQDGDAFYSQQIRFMAPVDVSAPYLYIATRKGVFVSRDQGDSWEKFSGQGLPLEQITSLVVLGESQIFVGTTKGVFFYSNGYWKPLYSGMETSGINFLNKDAQNTIYAATDKGIFRLVFSQETPLVSAADYKSARKYFSSEPSIAEVQKMSIHYAEVSPEKIANWRRQAQKRAWLPDFSVGLDGNKNKTTSDSVWGSYSSGGQHYIGPDDKTFYDNFGWDVSLSWDLGDLVWSSDQTSIDSRSKLMVELREDILNEVTRLYFERRRLQLQMFGVQASQQEKMQGDFRIEELTALIDAFTGGEFSQSIAEQKIEGNDK